MKKQVFTMTLCGMLILSMVGVVFAHKARRDEYIMEYKLYITKVSGQSGAGATTAEASGKGAEVYAFVSVYSYKNGAVKNCNSVTKPSYAQLAIKGKGGNAFRSYHNLKRDNYRSIGESLELRK